MPVLGAASGVLRCLPPVFGAPVVERDCASAAVDVSLLEAAATHMATMHQSNLGTAAQMIWKHLHRLLPDDASVSQDPDVVEPFLDGECLRHGMCVCVVLNVKASERFVEWCSRK
eukprot:8900718-Pyramimonas_sp.AAC.1